jgi:hypothetical protein
MVREAMAVADDTITPTDRSNPPDMITIVSPKAAKSKGDARRRRLL